VHHRSVRAILDPFAPLGLCFLPGVRNGQLAGALGQLFGAFGEFAGALRHARFQPFVVSIQRFVGMLAIRDVGYAGD